MSGNDADSISLKVSKAIPSDVGHGRARISGENDLDLKPGDIIEIKVRTARQQQFTGEAAPKTPRWISSELMVSLGKMQE